MTERLPCEQDVNGVKPSNFRSLRSAVDRPRPLDVERGPKP